MEHLVRRRYWWFAFSLLVILPGLYMLFLHPLITTGRFTIGLKPSIDFAGGALWELRFPDTTPETLTTDQIAQAFATAGFENAQVQLSPTVINGQTVAAALVRTRPLSESDPNREIEAVTNALTATFGTVSRERLESVGPTVSTESTRSAVIAVLGASLVILLYLTWAFRKAPHPVRYGVCALISMLHDVLVVLGIAAILGATIGLEVDALFLTALLTTLSFSVHDTIVVFDRIRENLLNRHPAETFDDIVNHSLVQTLPRSINTQLTTFFTLTALLLFGGDTIRNFVLMLLIGLISGTYSSIFNAAQLLVVWEHREWRNWFGRGRRDEAAQAA
ncbi:MAG: protein-export membrane protein SecF [Chloroflexus sp.]|uniref:protein translocase subunit SecF n=1 Tax=Chloroflexus sp. TaxID=1904827 RepID=UPI0021DC215B|nr:protein translocase subunit SecF [Chloroflexus sp.]GIV89095.1 MAG: protein-export membrane protein SecF [Chloroflexus sp.]